MEVVRVLDLRLYDCRKQRFRDLVFKNSSRPLNTTTPDGRGGFSVVGIACVHSRVGGAICDHVEKYYEEVSGTPCALWPFDTAIFEPPNPNPHKFKPPELIQKNSDTGDECHHNLHNVSDNRLERAYRAAEGSEALELCFGGTPEKFTPERAVEAQLLRDPDD